MDLNIIEADLENPTHTEYILYLTNAYAMDEMGGGEPLKKEVYDSLIAGLKRAGNYLGFIALDGDDPVEAVRDEPLRLGKASHLDGRDLPVGDELDDAAPHVP